MAQIINEGPTDSNNLSGIQWANRIQSVPGWAEAPGYREHFSNDQSVVYRYFDVAWGTRKQFVDAMLGYSKSSADNVAGPVSLVRNPPDNHPEYPWLYATDVEMADAMGAVAVNQNSGLIQYYNADPTSSGAGNVRYKVTYRALDYEVYSNADLASVGGTELNRYVSRKWVWSMQSMPIPNANWLKFIEGPQSGKVIQANGQVLLFPMREVTYTWHQVPDVPQVAIDQADGSVNIAAFDVPLNVGGVEVGGYGSQTQGYQPGTLLCMTPQVERKRNIVGRVTFDISYKFLYRPQGWNKFPLFSGGQPGFYAATFDGKPANNNNSVFQQTDFTLLFNLPSINGRFQNANG